MSLTNFFKLVNTAKSNAENADTLGVAYQSFAEIARISDSLNYLGSNTPESLTAAANTAVTRTYNAPGAGKQNFIGRIQASYSGTGTGLLTITEGATIVYRATVSNTNQVFVINTAFLENTAVTVTLAAGGAGFTGNLNIFNAGVV